MTVTGRTALVAAVAALVVAAVPAHGAAFVVVDLLLVALVCVDLALAGRVSGTGLHRDGDEVVRQGDRAVVRLWVVNNGSRRWRGWVRDAWAPSAGAGATRHPVDVPPGEQRVVTTELRPTRRGDRRPDRVTLRSVGPLGLAGRQRSAAVPWTLRVLPAFASRRHLPEKLSRLRELDGLVVAPVRGAGTEFDSLREYVVGDDPRAIDWRATARARDVVIRTWRPERDRLVFVVVDTGRTSAARVGDAPRLDAALEASMLLTALASRAGDRVDVLAHDRRLRVAVSGQRRDVLAAVVRALAPLEPALVESDHGLMAAEVLRRARRRALVVLLTSLDTATVQTGLLPALPTLLRRHVLLVAAVEDPAVEALAAGRGDLAAVYGAAAAEGARAERAAMAAALRRRGVEVVQAPPADFAPAVADAYLSLKATGRL